MKRVVITGLGAASTLGLEMNEIEQTLRNGKSCITYCPDFEEHGFNSLVAGCGEASAMDIFEAANAMQEYNKPRRIGIRVPKTMGSSRSANITMLIKNSGMSLGISDACATGLVNIGYAYQVVKYGIQDVVFAGGGESCDWAGSAFFDAMGVVPSAFNDNPSAASRPFDKDRAGFVMAEGGGIVVVEELQHALSRGAQVYGEIIGYATNCDGGYSMVAPLPERSE